MNAVKIPTKGPGIQAAKPEAPRSSIWQRELKWGNPFPDKLRLQFYHSFGLLLESGLNMLDSLEILQEQFPYKPLDRMLNSLLEDVKSGIPLSQGLSRQSEFFSAFESFTLKMGEQTGQMAAMMQGLAHYFDKRVALRRKLTKAFSYPITVIAIATLVMGFMIGFVVPMFEDIFSRFDAELPYLTQRILGMAHFFTDHILSFFAGIFALIWLFHRLRKHQGWRRFWSTLTIKFPGLGPLLLHIHLARFSYSFALLLRARVNLDQSLMLLSEVTTLHPLKEALSRVHKAVLDGQALFEAMASEPLFPMVFRQMVKVGEQTARLEDMFGRMAHTLETESESSLDQLTRFLEPLLIILLGGMVAVILISMYLPMFELSNAVG